jgi:hypothetical protein
LVRLSGSSSFARSCCVSFGVMIAGHLAFATKSPRCSRSPLIRREISILRSVWLVHAFPVTVPMPPSLRSVQIDRSESPAITRRAQVRITSASSARMLRLSDS